MINTKIQPADLVVFFIPPEKFVGGGMISIFSLALESRLILGSMSEVVVCTYPGYKSYRHNDLFENDEYIYEFEEAMKKFSSRKRLLIHIPENDIELVENALEPYSNLLLKKDGLQFNILNQNIQLMPGEYVVSKLFKFSSKITQTTAHLKYATQDLSNKYAMPVHHMSVFIDPTNYSKTAFESKKNIIAVSPDKHPKKDLILNLLSQLPGFEVREIKDLKYQEYKNLVSECKYVLTFGEGFDGYYIETVFSGNIGFAVYNDEFFPDSSYKKLQNIYSSYEELVEKICDDIIAINNEKEFSLINQSNQRLLEKIYSHDTYVKKISRFYEGKYDYLPEEGAAYGFIYSALISAQTVNSLLRRDLDDRNASIASLSRSLEDLAKAEAEKERRIHELNQEVASIYSSHSWRLTSFVRKISSLFKK